MTKKILVTGAGGYIGSHVVNALLELGMEVIAVDRNTDGINPRAQVINYDIFNGNPRIYEELGKPDVCVHLAWKDGFVHNSEAHLHYLEKHYLFVRDMVEAGLKQVLVMGSMHEVGYYEGEIDEDTPTKPISLYGIAKNALREALTLLAANHDLVFQWCRGYYIYGDDWKNNSIFSKLLQAAEDGKKTFPFTTGLKKYDFIKIQDLALQIALVAVQDKITGVINCCHGKPEALKDIVEKFIQDNALDIELEYGVFPDRPYDSPAIWGNSKKIAEIICSAMPDLPGKYQEALQKFI